jgi:uncharacterized surface protein with fasciclin (FAS1) repeats
LSRDRLVAGATTTWIHSIDRVLIDSIPPQTIAEYLGLNHARMLRWIRSTDQDLLQDATEVTVFAPSDHAFRQLPWALTERLYTDHKLLNRLLANHFVVGIHYSLGLLNRPVRARSGVWLQVTQSNDNRLRVNSIKLTDRDLNVKNGVVHPIDRVLLSPEIVRECNCFDSATLADILNQFTLVNITTNAIATKSNEVSRAPRLLEHVQSSSSNQANEHFKRHFRNLTNMAYDPSLTSVVANKTLLKPMVIYDQSDSWTYPTTGSSSPKSMPPVAYHTNHNYAHFAPSQSHNQPTVHHFQNTSRAFNRSILDQTIDLNLSPPNLPLYNPFVAIANYTLEHHHSPYNGLSFPLEPQLQLTPPPIPPPQLPVRHQHSYHPLPVSMHLGSQLPPSQFKFLNDLTTPASVHFDPTRRPKHLKPQQMLINYAQVEPMQPQQSSRLQSNQQPRLNPMKAQLAYYPTKSTSNPTRQSEPSKASTAPLTLHDVIREPRLQLDGQPARFTIFEHLLNKSSLSGLTIGASQVTLFLPNDEAFLRLPRAQRLMLGISSRRNRNKRDHDANERVRTALLVKVMLLGHISPVLVRPSAVDAKGISIEAFSNHSLHLSRQGSVSSRRRALFQAQLYFVTIHLFASNRLCSSIQSLSERLLSSQMESFTWSTNCL